MAEGRIAMTELEERFSGDKNKAELAKVTKELEGYLAQAKKALNGGLAPAEFQKMSKYCAALEQALGAVSMVWAASVKL